MEQRPKLTIASSPLDKALETMSVVLLTLLWGLTIFAFIKLPATIPIHFNGAGVVDSYGNKGTLVILPLIATAIYFGITQLTKYPHIFNYIKPITLENVAQQYVIATRLMRFLKLSVLLVFSLIVLFTYLTTTGVSKGLGNWFLPLTLALFLLPVIYAVIRSTIVK